MAAPSAVMSDKMDAEKEVDRKPDAKGTDSKDSMIIRSSAGKPKEVGHSILRSGTAFGRQEGVYSAIAVQGRELSTLLTAWRPAKGGSKRAQSAGATMVELICEAQATEYAAVAQSCLAVMRAIRPEQVSVGRQICTSPRS